MDAPLSSTTFSKLSAKERIAAIGTLQQKTAVTVSMQKSACVLLHMIAKTDSRITPLFVDTGYMHPETLEMVEQYQTQLGLQIKILYPALSVESQMLQHGGHLYPTKEGVQTCCRLRRQLPLITELKDGYHGKVAGIMRSEEGKRKDIDPIETDKRISPNFMVYHPLFDWTREQLDRYLQQHALPIHPLYEQGYESIGCAPCTTPVLPGENPRAGRWRHIKEQGEEKAYCLMNWSDARSERVA